MKALSASHVAAAVIVALAGLPALANTTASSDSKGMERATQSSNANVTTGQEFQDKHDNAVDANKGDTQKVAKKKVKKAKRVARTESKDLPPQ